MPPVLIAIDQGTTSTRAIAFDAALRPLATAQRELRQIYPAPGEVEHDPEEIWTAVVDTVRKVIAQARIGINNIAGIGITNQRETIVIWDRETGKRSTMQSSGKIGVRLAIAKRCGAHGTKQRSREGRDFCSIHISPPPKLPGC